MERLALLLGDMELNAPDFYLAVVDQAAANEAMLFAQALRQKGLTGEVGFAGGSMKSRMRAANKSGAKTCLILGGSELADETITVKDMAGNREQETLDRKLYLASL
jgi:histidyl-tRNA synthetase